MAAAPAVPFIKPDMLIESRSFLLDDAVANHRLDVPVNYQQAAFRNLGREGFRPTRLHSPRESFVSFFVWAAAGSEAVDVCCLFRWYRGFEGGY